MHCGAAGCMGVLKVLRNYSSSCLSFHLFDDKILTMVPPRTHKNEFPIRLFVSIDCFWGHQGP